MKDFFAKNKNLLLSVFGIGILFTGLPVLVFIAQQRQILKGQAVTTASQTCGNAPVDYMLIIDRSDSMKGAKLTSAQTAANNFIDIIAKDTRNKVGLITFAPTATLSSSLTTNYSVVKAAVNAIQLAFGTNMQDAVVVANRAFAADVSSNKKVAIFLTDGKANVINGSSSLVNPSVAEAATITEIKNGYAINNAPYYTIGLGTQVNAVFLQQIASLTGASYSFSPNATDLNNIYGQISTVAGKGSVGGFVFNDQNNNKAYDSTEPKLSSWSISVKDTNGLVVGSATSDTSGNYLITNLCDGSYTVEEQLQTGWTQTMPVTPPGTYAIAIANGSAIADKEFGNNLSGPPTTPSVTQQITPTPSTGSGSPTPKITQSPTPATSPTVAITTALTPTVTPLPITLMPTPTVNPADTSVNAKVFLDGRGNAGDSMNHHGGNKNLLHPQQMLDVSVIGANNQLIASASGLTTIDALMGNFTGAIDLGKITNGVYNIRLHVRNYLTGLIPGVQLAQGTIVNLPSIYLIAGDLNNDNQVDVQDYNIFIQCYSSSTATVSIFVSLPGCSSSQKINADLNDDGNVDLLDYNLFIRELSIRKGQ